MMMMDGLIIMDDVWWDLKSTLALIQALLQIIIDTYSYELCVNIIVVIFRESIGWICDNCVPASSLLPLPIKPLCGGVSIMQPW